MRIKTCGLFALLLAAAALAAACSSGPGIKLDPESDAFYSTARLIMTKEEERIFRRLPDPESRKEFIADFWEKRDPNPGTDKNVYKLEFEGRVDYANKRFREGGPGYNTDRGRIYIFMGPPDKFEEYFTHNDPDVRGPILWWIYYDYYLGIEFVDERNNGQYKIRRYDGNFFEALDQLKLGQWVMTKDVFKKRVVKFDLAYDPAREALTITIPADSLTFRENEEGKFQVDLEFIFYIYPDEGKSKETYRERKIFSATNAELLDLKTTEFVFSRPLPPGTNYVDVIIKGSEDSTAKIRKIFEIKVSS